ncbi:MAG: ABC-2 family transporter protein [Verrucomicrobia bacterium]|nr:ABC-2 family transporter protein [Verrucomicrobiota bacterium]
MSSFLTSALKANFRLSFRFRLAFLSTLVIIFMKQIFFLITWSFFFNKYKSIHGWDFSEMLAMYGIVTFAIGFVELFFYGLKDLPRIIETHQIDIFLLQPKNLILNIALSKGNLGGIGEMLLGVFLLAYSQHLYSLMIPFILSGAILFIFSLYLYLGSIAFFLKNSTGFIYELYQNATIVATQPNSAYSGLFWMFTLTILPTAYVSYFPVEYLRTGMWIHLLYAFLGIVVFFAIACGLFRFGLKQYESGSAMAHRF